MRIIFIIILISFTKTTLYSQNTNQMLLNYHVEGIKVGPMSQLNINSFYEFKRLIIGETSEANNKTLMLKVVQDKKGCGVSVIYWVLGGALLGTAVALLSPHDEFWPPVSIGAGIGLIAWLITCPHYGKG